MTDQTAVTEPRRNTPLREEAYWCRVCCSQFYGASAIRHRAHNERVRREDKANGTPQRLQ